MKTVDLVYFNAGGGHRAAATALSAILKQEQPTWNVRCVNLTEVLDSSMIGTSLEDLYNRLIRKGWTFGLAHGLKILQQLIKLNHEKLTRILQKHWEDTQPDMVVSLIPNFNRSLFESVSSVIPGIPYVTVLTDIADYPSNFWIVPGQKQYFICGSDRAIEQAKEQGCEDWQLYKISGMLIRPDFYTHREIDRVAELEKVGFDSRKPVGVVMFGGQGSKEMVTISKKLPNTQLILMCGHNKSLATQLRKVNTSAQHLVLDFTPDVNYYMTLGDFFVGKPGPGSLSEAIQQNLPVITFRNKLTMPQEKYNTEWIENAKLGLVIKSAHDIDTAVQSLFSNLDMYKENTSKIDNKAIFEISDLLKNILEHTNLDKSRTL